MSRRALTLLLAGLLAVGLTASAAVARVPYVALGPGPTYDTLGEVEGEPVLEVVGRRTFPTDGQLDLTTVGVQPRLTLAQALQGWFSRELAVVPREVVFPPGRTDDEVEAENAASMAESQGAAVGAAASYLGLKPVVTVQELGDGSPATGRLKVGDRLTAVDGKPVEDAAALRELISSRDPGTSVRVTYVRGSSTDTAEIVTGAAGEDGSRAVIGVLTQEDYPLDVTINLEDIGGPSAGLMFALGILEKVGEKSLTGGKHIAGTGEISTDGTVGPIGGISQKLLAAKRAGAVAFLVPAQNCAEALGDPPAGLTLIRAGTLTEALAGLEALRDGGSPTTCAA